MPSSKDLLSSESDDLVVIPGGWGAAGGPNDGFHQLMHRLITSFTHTAIGAHDSLALRQQLDQMQLSVQSGLSSKCLAAILRRNSKNDKIISLHKNIYM